MYSTAEFVIIRQCCIIPLIFSQKHNPDFSMGTARNNDFNTGMTVMLTTN